jgi:SAM-dependent methyltransferase
VLTSSEKLTDSEKYNLLVRGFMLACGESTEAECLTRMLFGTDRTYGPVVIRIRKGDLLFLNNIETDSLHGVFRAVTDGGFNIEPKAWKGRYPYQVRVETLGDKITLNNATKILRRFGMTRNTPLHSKRLAAFLDFFLEAPSSVDSMANSETLKSHRLILEEKERIANWTGAVDIDEEIPMLEATTFWDFPRQSYGSTPKGDNKYAGVTPALIIYNLVWRYTDPGDLVVDPMCGSGTTIDVCREEGRRAIGYDITPVRADIIQNDARKIPLENDSVDMVFIDSPYGDNLRYSDHPDNIGNISSESEKFYDELEKVMCESYRILKDGKTLGWLIGDQWVKHRFTPVGFMIYNRLCKYFEPVDMICVSRRGQSSHTGPWFNRARRFNFYLRGFKYLIIVKKTTQRATSSEAREIEWTQYKRR